MRWVGRMKGGDKDLRGVRRVRMVRGVRDE